MSTNLDAKIDVNPLDATTAEEWRELAATTEFASKQWKHDYIGPDHLLMALITSGTPAYEFLSEQGMEAAVIRDMEKRLFIKPRRQSPPMACSKPESRGKSLIPPGRTTGSYGNREPKININDFFRPPPRERLCGASDTATDHRLI